MFDYNKDDIPEIIIDNNLFTFKDGEFMFLEKYNHADILQTYSTDDQFIYFKAIYEYRN